ncbi:RNA polymerase sigma factor [Nonomuraea sp. LPB2021202275-12-8]|uniref:RNA polymerase sigma factor n=1 Tax=Nonomuraea sp. LPB2021202275-12-8 TaxID=3120159 RepID=UPI00300D016D
MTDVSPGSVPVSSRGSERRSRLATLLEQAAGGRREALDEIVAELTPMLWHAVRAQGLDYHLAQDVVQTTWLTLVRHLHSIRSPGALIEWLITAARREAWRVSSGGNREDLPGSELLDEIPDPEDQPDEAVVLDERRRALWTAVERLPRRCRDLLRIIAFVRRPDYDAVAAALGMPKGSIGPTRGRCLTKLRAQLSQDPQWSSP